MNISLRTEYATRAMLALARCSAAGPLSIGQIATTEDISPKYLQQVMAPLIRAGLVRAMRGSRGGFVLAKPAEDTKMGDILRAVEGEFCLLDCVRFEDVCPRASACSSRPLWVSASALIEDFFDSLTLADVLLGNVPAPP